MEKIILYGLGAHCIYLLQKNRELLNDVVALSDKDNKKWGKKFWEKPVISPSEIKNYTCDKLIVGSRQHFGEIKEELQKKYGYNNTPVIMLDDYLEEADKGLQELAFWQERYLSEGFHFRNEHYRNLYLGIAGEKDDSFLAGKVIADFGCGPRGSLAWTGVPLMKIGIDLLAKEYVTYFGSDLVSHGMYYVNSSEKHIPIPDASIDVISTINSLDHVRVLDNMVSEILRILKPGGILLGSFNLNEPPTPCEPITLKEQELHGKLFSYFQIDSYKKAYSYDELLSDKLLEMPCNDEQIKLWVRGTRLSSSEGV